MISYPNNRDCIFYSASANALVKNIKFSMKILEPLIQNDPFEAINAYYEEDFLAYKNDPDWLDFLFGEENRIRRMANVIDLQRSTYNFDEEKFNLGLHYIKKESNVIPPKYTDYYDSSHYTKFIQYLAPYEIWSELDQRIIDVVKSNFINLSNGYYQGCFYEFVYWTSRYYNVTKNGNILMFSKNIILMKMIC